MERRNRVPSLWRRGVQLADTANRPTETQANGELATKERVEKRLANLKLDDKAHILEIFDELVKVDSDFPPEIRRKNNERNHEFLSQQIDERSHQVFTIGPLFVPVSFLILTYAVTGSRVGLEAFVLMVGSLTCFISFFLFYERVRKLNASSYDHIFAIELRLGLSAHLTLNEFYKRSPLLQKTKYIFKVALAVLAVLWTAYLVGPLSPQIASFTTSIGSLLFGSLLLSLCLTPTTVVILLFLILYLLSNNEGTKAGFKRIIAAVIALTVAGAYCITGTVLVLSGFFGPLGVAAENLIGAAASSVLGLVFLLGANSCAHRKYEQITDEQQGKKEQISGKPEVGAADRKEPTAETNAGSQQPSTSGATSQTTVSDQDKKEASESQSPKE